jgi:hypothetical protein
MRQVKINGRNFSIRPLKRKEIKALNEKGLPLNRIVPEKAEDTMEAVFEKIFDKKTMTAIDDLEYREVLHVLWPEVMAETFSSPGEEKNSEASGPGTTIKTE